MASNDPEPPANVRLGQDSRITGPEAFKRYFSQRDIGLSLGGAAGPTANELLVSPLPEPREGRTETRTRGGDLHQLRFRSWAGCARGARHLRDDQWRADHLRRIDSDRRLRARLLERDSDGQLPCAAFDCTKTRLRCRNSTQQSVQLGSRRKAGRSSSARMFGSDMIASCFPASRSARAASSAHLRLLLNPFRNLWWPPENPARVIRQLDDAR